jgi:hypothetical protein
MPAGCRRWTIYNLSWALLALKAAFSMTCNNDMQGVAQYEYPRFEKEACCSHLAADVRPLPCEHRSST